MKAIQLLIFILLSSGCGLFKKTSKTQSTAIRQSEKQMEFNEFILKSANKETKVFTYWNDSGFYQMAQIREEKKQSGSGRIKVLEKENDKTKNTAKQTEPVKLWTYFVIAAAAFGFYLIYRRLQFWFR